MPLSTLATEFAAAIRAQPWTAPYWTFEGGDPEYARLNVMWVTAKVLATNDPNFDVYEFSLACGCAGRSRKFIEAGITPYPDRPADR